MLICSYTSTITPINTEPMPYHRNFYCRMCQITLHFQSPCYPKGLIVSAINSFILRNASAGAAERNTDDSSTVRITLLFKDQVTAYAVRKKLRDISHKILPTLQPVFVSKKLGQDLKHKEFKPPIVNRQCVVYRFSCGSSRQQPPLERKPIWSLKKVPEKI